MPSGIGVNVDSIADLLPVIRRVKAHPVPLVGPGLDCRFLDAEDAMIQVAGVSDGFTPENLSGAFTTLMIPTIKALLKKMVSDVSQGRDIMMSQSPGDNGFYIVQILPREPFDEMPDMLEIYYRPPDSSWCLHDWQRKLVKDLRISIGNLLRKVSASLNSDLKPQTWKLGLTRAVRYRVFHNKWRKGRVIQELYGCLVLLNHKSLPKKRERGRSASSCRSETSQTTVGTLPDDLLSSFCVPIRNHPWTRDSRWFANGHWYPKGRGKGLGEGRGGESRGRREESRGRSSRGFGVPDRGLGLSHPAIHFGGGPQLSLPSRPQINLGYSNPQIGFGLSGPQVCFGPSGPQMVLVKGKGKGPMIGPFGYGIQ